MIKRRSNIGMSIFSLIVLSLIILGFSPPPNSSAKPTMESMPGQLVELIADPTYNPYRVPPPPDHDLMIQTATITVNYNPTSCSGPVTAWPADAKAAFNFAVSIWENLLTSTQTIIVDACWRSDLGAGVLGAAGPVNFFRNFTGAPQTNTWYSVALANSLAGTDLDPGVADISANFSSTFNWYLGTDGNPSFSQYDFVSVVLHELGHGLGFLGFGFVSSGIGQIDILGSPASYDRFTVDGSNTPLLNYADPSLSLGNALTGNAGGVFFNGSNANAANGGSRVELYAPSIWSQGSSYSHLGESFNNTPNALMTFSLANGESEHSPGPVTLGIFEDIGWGVASAPDLKITQTLVGNDHQPGDPVTFTLKIENIGSETATDVVVTDIVPSEILSPDFTSDISGISVQGSTTFVWNLPDLAASDSGTITLFGTINPSLPDDFAIVNTATIATSATETNANNNSSTTIVGGSRVFLPIVLK